MKLNKIFESLVNLGVTMVKPAKEAKIDSDTLDKPHVSDPTPSENTPVDAPSVPVEPALDQTPTMVPGPIPAHTKQLTKGKSGSKTSAKPRTKKSQKSPG